MPTTTTVDIARSFGEALDRDDFALARTFLAPHATYHLPGQETLVGPVAICGSYEENMLEGRQTFDELRWGACEIEEVEDGEVDVQYTDYLKHNGVEHIHRCKQRLTVGDDGLIVAIVHIDLPGEREAMTAFCERVGIAD